MSTRENSAAARAETAAEEWQRARRPEHKAERRRAIVEAAEALLDEHGVEGATLSEIARQAGLSKANCYRYFETREAILLAVALDEGRGWSTEIVDRLGALADSRDVESVARTFASTTVAHPRFCMLLSALSSVLERNVSVEAIAEFKRSFHALLFDPAAALMRAIPELTAEHAQAFLRFFGLLTVGSWPNANPAPAVAEVMSWDEFASMHVDHEELLFEHARVLLHGLLADTAVKESR